MDVYESKRYNPASKEFDLITVKIQEIERVAQTNSEASARIRFFSLFFNLESENVKFQHWKHETEIDRLCLSETFEILGYEKKVKHNYR